MKIFSNVVSRLLGFAVVVGLVGGFATAQAQSEKSYSSIARAPGWAYGYALGYSSRHNADVAAINECQSRGKGQCQIEGRFRGAGCVAIAKAPDGHAGWAAVSGYSNNRESSQNRALNRCRKHGPGCYVSKSSCTES